MQFPPFKGFGPSDAMKQLSQWVNQPTITNAIKEAAQKIGITDTSPLANVQEMLRNAGRWVESVVEPWTKSGASELRPGINGTGEWFHSRWTSPRLPTRSASLTALLQSNFTDGHAIDSQLAKELMAATGASDAIVAPNVPIALLLVSKALHEADIASEVILPRSSCVRLPNSASLGGVHVRSVLDASGVRVEEIGSSADCRPEDYRGAVTHAKQLLVLASPQSVDDAREAGLARVREVGGLACEIALDGCIHDLPSIGSGVRALSRRWEDGPDLIVVPGQFLLSGPECGIVLGKRDVIATIRKSAEEWGMMCDHVTAAILCHALQNTHNHDQWLQTPTGAALTTSIENLENRARRISVQADVSEHIDRLEVHRQAFKLGTGMWQGIRLESAVLRIYPQNKSPSAFADELVRRKLPVWCNVHTEYLEIVMRSIDPSEDAILVESLLKPQDGTENSPPSDAT